jgi:hypothetical protein
LIWIKSHLSLLQFPDLFQCLSQLLAQALERLAELCEFRFGGSLGNRFSRRRWLESIALAISMNAFGQEGADIALIIALAYGIQLQTSAWCNKFVDRCFGSRREVESPALVGEEA